jgi:L-alanine-DL-glutamate epimerase-like enolase superfamily enzyme
VADYLSSMPPTLDAFHLLGGLDKLTEGELGPGDPSDGLPVSLDQWIRRDGLRCFKVKLRGRDLPWDLQRVLDVVSVVRREQSRLGIGPFWLTADTNEMCESPDYMEELLVKFRERDAAAFDRLLYIEQPCERDLLRRKLDVRKLAAIKPVLVDESLVSLADLDLALDLGYSGGALKTCKCQSMELLIAAKAKQLGCPISVQDLANPGIALIQSAKLVGHLRPIGGLEYNSRQFYPSLSDPERRIHPGVFQLQSGRINTRSIHGPGFGYRWDEIGRTTPGAVTREK